MKILSVVGTRPNFMKIAPLVNELKKRHITHVLVHTGQHYDRNMSQLFFQQLKLPKPDINLGIGSGSIAEQTGAIITQLDTILRKEKPDIVLVVGDVNSTFAAAFVSKQLHIPVAHVEAGLRSFDWSMPEEINRALTDRISDFLFTTEESANKNLRKEGVDSKKIHFVGNVMIDSLLAHAKLAKSSLILSQLLLTKKSYAVVTLHRPNNVDTKKALTKLLDIIADIQKKITVVFPIHPRTRKNLEKFGLTKKASLKHLILTEPLGYLDFLCLMNNSKLVLTDSGGIQEETTVLGIPCITLRSNTERPVTLTKGTNMLVGTTKRNVLAAVSKALSIKTTKKISIPLWDGNAAPRIVNVLLRH